MDLLTYTIVSAVLIMMLHFALGIGEEFKLFITFGIFILGAAMGAYLNSYEFGLGAAIVLSLINW
ncbi:hypothetical protein A3C25_00635 [Candidatus Roizmanbacteria bacterium RIFCSPHIGHO2_02_FULL_38_11]|uniref:Uncharacterized protein n=1 Tax=Candidatus Roizmanbacteria bacterium RIFCSPHIGHO2_02_FULL_38_11 TaxID=1802039 RepID=A0A1F7H267_9BACT|nr:MAG: hypothetical protein A3C25_00635 [Candidatus Roizmanbacteria bacterium RIFCSPHIGHO2_02_FULL_38_11]